MKNKSLAAFLVENPPVIGVKCSYYKDEEDAKRNGESFKETLYKTVLHDLEVGERVVVETKTRHCETVMRVTQVDVDPDYDSTKEILWVVGRVDRDLYQQAVHKEQQILEKIKAGEERKKRKEVQEAMYGNLDIDTKALTFDGTAEVVDDPPSS